MKKNKPTQLRIYQLVDKVAKTTLGIFTFKTNSECVRSLFPTYYPIMPLRDMEIREIGYIDLQNCITIQPPVVVGWDCYKLPESHAENLKEIGMTDEQVKDLFKKRIEQSSTEVQPIATQEIKVKDSE